MEKIKIIVVICERSQAKKINAAMSNCGVSLLNTVYGYGTARNEVLSMFGFGELEKAVVFGSVKESGAEKAFNILKTDFRFGNGGRGIAFTVPVTAAGGIATVKLMEGKI